MRCIKWALLAVFMFSTSLAAAQAVGTHAAGNPGSRSYSNTFTSSGSFVVPLGVSTLFVTGCGAGGGGAGGHTSDPGGGGGGGGTGVCTIGMPLTVVPGSTLTVTIGTAGVGSAAGLNGGVTNTNTTLAGLPIGTYTWFGANNSAGTGTVTNGGAGGQGPFGGNGATGTGAGATNTVVISRQPGGDYSITTGGAAGGGATGPGAGGSSIIMGGYNTNAVVSGGSASGTKGGGGAGGSSVMGVGGAGGSNAVGAACTVGYGAGGGGGAPTFAGGNGCPGVLIIDWMN